MRQVFAIFGVVLATTAFHAAPAMAAPQVLALLPSDSEIVLRCDGADCAAEVSTICLQPERATPVPGQAYTALTDDHITLTAHAQDGTPRALSLDGALSINVTRGYYAVRLSVPRALLREQELQTVSVRIAEITAIVPAPMAGDAWPQSDADVALASGPLRTLAARIVRTNEARRDAARITAAAVNVLPPVHRVDKAEWQRAWSVALGEAAGDAGAGARALAQSGFEECRQTMANGWYFRIRDCLGRTHDGLVGAVNDAYWEELKAGS